MATIWSAPFTFSTLRIPLNPVVSLTGLEDEWGIPIVTPAPPITNGLMIVTVKLRPTKQLTKEGEISLALEKASVLFEGFVIKKEPAGLLIPGTKGKGEVNGQTGEIKLIATGQSSLGIIRKILGEKIRIEFTRTLAKI